jgi:hypothetical protein
MMFSKRKLINWVYYRVDAEDDVRWTKWFLHNLSSTVALRVVRGDEK